MTIHQASCQCGQLTVSLFSAPVIQLVCHCEDCRATSGAPFTRVAFFVAQPETVTGTSRRDRRLGDSGKPKHNHHCPRCGDFVYAEIEALKGLWAVKAERIAKPFAFSPKAHVWVGRKLPETRIPEGAVTFAKAPALSLMSRSSN